MEVFAVMDVNEVDVDANHHVYQNCYLLNYKNKPIKQLKHDFVYLSVQIHVLKAEVP